MKKFMFLSVTAVILLVFSGLASAVTIDYAYISDANGDPTTPYSWATVETFDNGTTNPFDYNTLLWSWNPTGEFTVRQGPLVSGESAPPAGDSTFYVSVPQLYDLDNTASVTVNNLGGTYDYFGIFWGSVDTYNTLSFYNGTSLVGSYTGSDAITPSAANGNQTAPSTNLYVNFYFDNSEVFDSFVMSSTTNGV